MPPLELLSGVCPSQAARELAPGAELGRIGDSGRQRARYEQAHARNGGNAPREIVRAVPGQQVSFELADAVLSLDRLLGQGANHLGGEIGNLVRPAGDCASHEGQGVGDPLRDIDAELGQEPTDPVHELRTLTKIAAFPPQRK